MKPVVIILIVMGIVFIYFVVKAERSLVVTGGNDQVSPLGIDIPELIFGAVKDAKNQMPNQMPEIIKNLKINDFENSKKTYFDSMIANVKETLSETAAKAGKLIKTPIENKVDDILCPQK